VKAEVFCFPLALLTGNVDHSTDKPHCKKAEKERKKEERRKHLRSHGVTSNRTKEQKPNLCFQLSQTFRYNNYSRTRER
jgi:hypothetical protein